MALQFAKIQHSAGPDKDWRPDVFHRVHPRQVGKQKLWWFQAIEGISVLSEDAVRRTRGAPRTIRRLRKQHGDAIIGAQHRMFQDGPLHQYNGTTPQEASPNRYEEIEVLLAAIMATESGGRCHVGRYEPHLRDWSFGPMQFLTATAWQFNRSLGLFDKALKPVPKGGDFVAWKHVLADPEVSLCLACALLRYANKRWKLQGDPMQLYASYNAGSPVASRRTPWGLRGYDRDGLGPAKGALDHFAAWYGDACAVWFGGK